MPTKEQLIKKLCAKPSPAGFTIHDMESLMSKCGCLQSQGGRGSGIKYFDPRTKRILIFDLPHPGKELKKYHVKKLIVYLQLIGEIEDEK